MSRPRPCGPYAGWGQLQIAGWQWCRQYRSTQYSQYRAHASPYLCVPGRGRSPAAGQSRRCCRSGRLCAPPRRGSQSPWRRRCGAAPPPPPDCQSHRRRCRFCTCSIESHVCRLVWLGSCCTQTACGPQDARHSKGASCPNCIIRGAPVVETSRSPQNHKHRRSRSTVRCQRQSGCSPAAGAQLAAINDTKLAA